MFLAGVFFTQKLVMAEYFNQLRRLLQAQGESFEEDVRKLVIQSTVIYLQENKQIGLE